MDTVAANSSSDHVDDITRTWSLVMALTPIGEPARHDADGTTVDQWLAEVALIENHGSVDCGDT